MSGTNAKKECEMTTFAGLIGGVIDVDNHYYEPADAFTRHIDPDCRDLALVAQGPVPGSVGTVGEHQCLSFTVPGVPVDHVPPPGFSAGIFDSSSELETRSFIGEAPRSRTLRSGRSTATAPRGWR
jgi:hypothetical protein